MSDAAMKLALYGPPVAMLIALHVAYALHYLAGRPRMAKKGGGRREG